MVQSGEEALHALKSRSFDLMLVDVQMPEMDGLELAKSVRQRWPQSGIKIAALSLMGANDAWRRTPDIDTCLMKPIGMSDLRQLIDSLVAGFAERSSNSSEAAQTVSGGLAAIGRITLDSRATGQRVLLVEDNIVNQTLARLIMEGSGHVVVVASDGSQAVDAWQSSQFDLILMDMQMPVMDGLTACATIREREAARGHSQLGGRRRIPIIALTARAMQEDRELCFSAGMDGFLTKPIDAGELLAAIADAAPARPILTLQ
jgi:CheY-like chemotaxis protein